MGSDLIYRVVNKVHRLRDRLNQSPTGTTGVSEEIISVDSQKKKLNTEFVQLLTGNVETPGPPTIRKDLMDFP